MDDFNNMMPLHYVTKTGAFSYRRLMKENEADNKTQEQKKEKFDPNNYVFVPKEDMNKYYTCVEHNEKLENYDTYKIIEICIFSILVVICIYAVIQAFKDRE